MKVNVIIVGPASPGESFNDPPMGLHGTLCVPVNRAMLWLVGRSSVSIPKSVRDLSGERISSSLCHNAAE